MTTLLTGVNGGSFANTTTGPAAGEFITAASVNNGLQGVLNECKYLYDTKANLAGATFTGLVTCSGGLTVPAGQTLTIAGPASLSGTLETTSTGIVYINSGGTFTVQGTSKAYLQGKTMWPDPQRLTNADHTISVHDGTTVILATPTAVRTITVEQATDPPLNGERIDFELYAPGGVGNYYEIKREGSANYIVRLDGYDGSGTIMEGRCSIQFEGGVWRLLGGIGLAGIGTDA